MANSADKLVVKCTFDKWHKRIVFNSARNCSYDLLKKKIEECFALYNALFSISYKDDDGEITNIATDGDLSEAIQYFQAGDDAPMSSAASILSGRSFGPRKITLRVNIMVDYDGPSLSDTSSLASIEEYKGRNGSQLSFSYGTPNVELDDDSVTVSSRDPGNSSVRSGKSFGSSLKSLAKQRSFVNSEQRSSPSTGKLTNDKTQIDMRAAEYVSQNVSANPFNGTESATAAAERFPADPSAIFERLKLSETLQDDSSSINTDSLAASERGAAWLRDQNERTIRSMLGALPEPSISDDHSFSFDSESDSLGGDLALERDPRGKYYYTYTSGSASQNQGSIADEEAQSGNGDIDVDPTHSLRGPRPTSMQLNWLASQQINQPRKQRPESDLLSLSIQEEPTGNSHYTIDKALLPFLPVPGPPPEILTECSHCHLLLDSIRYICAICGPKDPVKSFASEKGKERDSSPVSSYTYPPTGHLLFSSPNSSSSQTYVASSESFDTQRYKPLPSLPSFPSLRSLSSPGSTMYHNAHNSPSQSQGYELCSACLEAVGVDHAIDGGLAAPGSPLILVNRSEEEAAARRRLAPKKGQLRHAFREKVWGHLGWEDVVLDEALISKCSTCSAVTEHQRYKCVSCRKLHMCRACYSQAHELHPTHPFLSAPDKPADTTANRSDEYDTTMIPNPHEELSLTHPGVKCAHCLRDIVGARFHCAICDAVDICSNCESAGLPGNLDSADGGHTSSHILIKIPYPLETTELQNASRRALNLWTGRDAVNVGFAIPRSKAESEISYARTMIGTRPRDSLCSNCNKHITGVRYQCAHCPSSPFAYNLCEECEAKSYLVHNPMHIFFKLPKPVRYPLESENALLPLLYKAPAGPAHNAPRTDNPKDYLFSLTHSAAICDRCMEAIVGEWFRCAYCSKDLCYFCEEVDTHDHTHVFFVLKAPVDMQLFKNFAQLESPGGSQPVLRYPVYV